MENSGGFQWFIELIPLQGNLHPRYSECQAAVHVQSSITPVTGRIYIRVTKSYFFISTPGDIISSDAHQQILGTQVPQATETWSLSFFFKAASHHMLGQLSMEIWYFSFRYLQHAVFTFRFTCHLYPRSLELLHLLTSLNESIVIGFTLLLFTHHN